MHRDYTLRNTSETRAIDQSTDRAISRRCFSTGSANSIRFLASSRVEEGKERKSWAEEAGRALTDRRAAIRSLLIQSVLPDPDEDRGEGESLTSKKDDRRLKVASACKTAR